MKCNSCNLREMCKLYEYIGKQRYAEVNIKTCKFNPDEIITLEDQKIDYSKQQTQTVPVTQYIGQAKPDLRTIEKQLKNEPEKPEPKKINCPSCDGLTYDDDIKICSKCGKKVCSNCGIAVDGQVLCDNCWKEDGEVKNENS